MKILTLFTSIDPLCNNLDGPIPNEIEVLNLCIFSTYHTMLSQAKFHYLWGLGGKLSELSGEIPEQLENTITLNFNYHHLKLNNWWN